MTGAVDPTAVLDRIRAAGIVAVIRAADADQARWCAVALATGGIRAVEIAFTTPGAASSIAAARSELDVLVGAGTLTTVDQVEQAVAADAEFLVSPGTSERPARAMIGSGRTCLLGALTPTEVMRARELGAHAVKIFPASLGGPAHLAALRGPFPDLSAVPTGGVGPGNLAEWFAAGAVAVGAGSDLCPPAVMDAGDWAEITRRARSWCAALESLRSTAAGT